MSVTLYPAAASVVKTGGEPVTVAFAGVAGGLVVNPLSAGDQGLNAPEPLFIDLVNPATAFSSQTTSVIWPGGTYQIPPGDTNNVTVNSASSGHKFSAYIVQPSTVFPPTPTNGDFPPLGPTSQTALIKSYVYEEYADDVVIQAFAQSFNILAQNYIDTFNALNLPVYTGAIIADSLLDWVAQGIYGISRPALSSGKNRNIGAFNTAVINGLAFNASKRIGPQNLVVTSDDIFKRIMTWAIYKGDGKVFNVRWLKRRIMRFLYGVDGADYNAGQTYRISVTFGVGSQINIGVTRGKRTITASGAFNRSTFNKLPINGIKSTYVAYPPIPNSAILQEAIDAGVLELPFQYTYVVTV